MKKYNLIETFLVKFLQEEVFKTGLKRAVVGISGGIDSAVVSVLAQKAFGDSFLGVMMPSSYSSQNSLDDALSLCQKFNIKYEKISIAELVSSYFMDKKADNLRIGNFSARMRMSVLYDISSRENALVLGTSNKSELLLGYGTIFGDLASAINPIGDMYKTEIFEFASHLGIPQSIIDKAPSADLWEGQSDESDLGFSYSQLDKILHLYVDKRMSKEELLADGYEKNIIESVISRIYKNQFKRKPPIVAKLSERTIGHDFLYPRDIKL
ncbi:MAG: NAD+ synthase [Sulfurospirillaceae bacterium]|nr:NAD+ synthase [Sulfurospirillaceae bacterium]MDD3463490.1 NAD+ synthase [Sulfurospirillaceae bacterium]